MKKVLVISYYWPPSGGAGVQRWLKYSKYLPEFGIEPVVVTVNPGEAAYPVIDNSLLYEVPKSIKVHTTRTFEPFEFYKLLSRKKQIPFAGFANEGKVTLFKKLMRFIRGNFFIPDGRIGWNNYAFEKCCELIESQNIDTFLITSPPQSSQLIGLKLKKKYKLKWIADIRDPWTDIYYYNKLYHTSWAKKKDARYEREVIEQADHLIVVSEAIKNSFAGKTTKVDLSKIHVIPNGFDENDFANKQADNPPEFVITYTGTITADYKIDAFIDGFKELINEHKDVKFKLRFVGSVAGVQKGQFEKKLYHAVEFVNHVSHVESINYLMRSTLVLLAIPDVKGNEGILTGKLFEYLASQKFIFCLGPVNGEAAQIIEECEAGISFEHSDAIGIKEGLLGLLNKWKAQEVLRKNSSQYKKYSRQIQAKNIAEIIL